MEANVAWRALQYYVDSYSSGVRFQAWFQKTCQPRISSRRARKKASRRLLLVFGVLLQELSKPLSEEKEEIELRQKQWMLMALRKNGVWIFEKELPSSLFGKSKPWLIMLDSWRAIPYELWHRKYIGFCSLLKTLNHDITIQFMQQFCPQGSKDHEFFCQLQIQIQNRESLQVETFFKFENPLIQFLNSFYLDSDSLNIIFGLLIDFPSSVFYMDDKKIVPPLSDGKLFWSHKMSEGFIVGGHKPVFPLSEKFIVLGLSECSRSRLHVEPLFWLVAYSAVSSIDFKIKWARKIHLPMHFTSGYLRRNIRIYHKQNLVFVPSCEHVSLAFYDLSSGSAIEMRQMNYLSKVAETTVETTVECRTFITGVNRASDSETLFLTELTKLLLSFTPLVLIHIILEYCDRNTFSIGQVIVSREEDNNVQLPANCGMLYRTIKSDLESLNDTEVSEPKIGLWDLGGALASHIRQIVDLLLRSPTSLILGQGKTYP